MSEYQLEIKQIVDYPRCRIYRQFIQNLMADRSIRTSGGSVPVSSARQFLSWMNCRNAVLYPIFSLTGERQSNIRCVTGKNIIPCWTTTAPVKRIQDFSLCRL